MLEFIVIGGLWFWILTALAAISILTCVEWENGGGATGLLVLYLVLLWIFSDFNPLTWLGHNPKTAVAAILLYFLLGTAWAVVKWYAFVHQQARRVRSLLLDFLPRHGLDSLGQATPEIRREWTHHCSIRGVSSEPPLIARHKDRILLWMSYWPLSAIWTLINDPVRRIFKMIYHRLGGFLQGVSNRAFADLEK